MAHMCITTKRLDVAQLCISHMEDINAACALREAAALEEADARVGHVALHMGLTEDAAKLFTQANRMDLVATL